MRNFDDVLDECVTHLPPNWGSRAQKKGSIVRQILSVIYKVVVIPIEERIDSVEERLNALESKRERRLRS